MKKIWYGGDIITMNDAQSPYVEAVLEDGGKIVATGSLDELKKKGPDAKLIDLCGKTMMPGFIDAHSHITQATQYFWAADLSECTSFEEIKQVICSYINANDITKDGFVFAIGYDPDLLEEKSHPTRAVLDEISTEIPIFAAHVSLHMGVANSAAMAAASITDNESGFIAEDGLWGILGTLYPKIKRDYMGDIKKIQNLYASYGITTVQDGASSEADFELLRKAGDEGILYLDVVSYLVIGNTTPEYIKKNCDYDGKYKNHLKIGGYKAVLDGSPQGKTAWLTQPYLTANGSCGVPWHTDEEVCSYIRQAINDNRQIIIHCNGDAASDQMINSAQLAEEKPGSLAVLRPVMIHSQTVREDQLDKMSELGIMPSFFVGHVYYWGDVHVKNLGEQRGTRVSPVASALKRGMRFTFHQDTPVTKPDMLHSVWCAVCRRTRSGRQIGPQFAVSVYDALRAITIDAAYQYFEENEKGSIAAGKEADFVILSGNPLKTAPEEIKNITVLETVKNGKVIYKV